ncbi:MAG: hypothetical protein JNK28_03380 [Burkholderiaceae bacterium]|nr:hypothetical protein [Burkholderiaceae bacterium]
MNRLFPIFALLAGLNVCAQDVSDAEIATQQQIRSASCAMNAMPKKSFEALLAATRTYMKERDSIELLRSFQRDDVPTYIAKCFDVHAKQLFDSKKSNREFANFYDGTERALRLHFVIELARRSNQSTDTIRRLNDQMFESLIVFNRENP